MFDIFGLKCLGKIMEAQEKLHFIPDQSTDKDLLGTHEPIADAIRDIILSDMHKPFVLGLFGSWGSGKSSVIDILRNKWSENIEFVYIDAWRKEKVNFVRNFIKKIARTLLPEKQADKVISKITKRVTIQKGGWKPNCIAVICFFIFIGLCGWLAIFTYTTWKNDPTSTFPSGELANLGLTMLIAIFFSLILPRYSMQFSNTIEDLTLDDPLTFRRIFIQEILNNTDGNICVVVDNIDRTRPEDAVNIIKVLKAFIVDDDEKESSMGRVCFLVPCDDKELCKHLEEKSIGSPKEFLRKFFNVSVRIPPLILNDSYHFALGLLKKVKLNYKNEQLRNIASVINSALSDNPRQPKQFINQLIARLQMHKYLFAKQSSDVIDEINEHPEWVAYFLVLQSEVGTMLPDKIENIDNFLGDAGLDEKQMSVMSSFLMRAKWAKPTSQNVWNQLLYLKLNQIFIEIPNFEEIYDAFVEKRFDDAQKLIEKVESADQDYIFEELLKYSRSDSHAFSNITYTILEIIKRKNNNDEK